MFADKPTIEFDAATHKYWVDGLSTVSVTQALKLAGMLDDRWFTEEGAWRGTAVHRACQLIDEEMLDGGTVAPEWDGYIEAYDNFLHDYQCKWGGIEEKLFHPLHRYIGTCDRFGSVNGMGANGLVVVDIKTGARQRWQAIQLAAYSQALSYRYSSTRFERIILTLSGDGKYKATPLDFKKPLLLREDMATFNAAARIANWKLEAA
jgi:hypothetical protein